MCPSAGAGLSPVFERLAVEGIQRHSFEMAGNEIREIPGKGPGRQSETLHREHGPDDAILGRLACCSRNDTKQAGRQPARERVIRDE